jgi:hypothetical protein
MRADASLDFKRPPVGEGENITPGEIVTFQMGAGETNAE